VAERQFGPYRLVRQIAVGGMAEIHLAKTKGIAGFEKYVALKMIHPNFAEDEQFIQMLVDEAKIAVQLNHANIAQTFDLGRVGDTFYITMEYVDGADLYKILRKGSETDGFEMPLDVCAFVGKEIASALDHAHRKRDHTGKTLGIVHRDVSPQNVLVSYSGEVKLVDFGIAKATMKARQTAVGVIKGKYYYMSPEQAWGDQIDYRSDIFSAGIVLYEMMTGQMLYLEEDLHRLLEMARNADIAPPSTLRRGIPPQLEKIVMHALAKDRRDRYQSAGDFATDLERFLHAYSPVFTGSKVAAMIKQVIGMPTEIADDPEVEVRDGPLATHTLSTDDLIMDKEELHQDENSVIFRVADLKPKKQATPAPEPRKKQPTAAGPRVTRQANLEDIEPPKPAPKPAPKQTSPIPPLAKPGAPKPIASATMPRGSEATRDPSVSNPRGMAIPSMPKPGGLPRPGAMPNREHPPGSKVPRDRNEATREVGPAPATGLTEDSGLLAVAPPPRGSMSRPDSEDLSESTTIGGPPSFGTGFLMENASEEGVDATVVSSAPSRGDDTEESLNDTAEESVDEEAPAEEESDNDDGPTMQRDFREQAKPKSVASRGSAPPALAAKIHAPAVSELRKPRASRKTPAGGVPSQSQGGGNVLQALVGGKPAEAMPTPRRAPTKTAPPPAPSAPRASPPTQNRNEDSGALTLPGDASVEPVRPGQPPPPGYQMPPMPQAAQTVMPQQPAYNNYATDASGMPMQTPAQGMPQQGYYQQPGYPPQYPPQPGYPQQYQYPPASGGWPAGVQPPGYAPPGVTPGALYQLQPYGAPPPTPMTLTGQLRLFEADEIGDKYKVSGQGARIFKIAIAAVIAISVAAGVTFFIIKSTRDTAPTVGSIRVESVPSGAEVTYDGVRQAGATPLTIESVPIGTRHEVKLELAKHKAYVETVDIPKRGGEVPVKAVMDPITGKLRVLTSPDGADIYVDGQLRGRAPMTISGIDMSSAKVLELRLKDHQPVRLDLTWPPNGEININEKLVK